MGKRKIIKLFETRSGNMEYLLNRDYISNGIATIPVHISEFNDVISPYSVTGYEAINPEFGDLLKTAAECAPPEYPLVLNIIENCLSQAEKEIITEVISSEFAYDLGMVEREEKRHTKVFVLMIVGLILSGILLYFTHSLADEPRELFFILFWFMGDTLCDYIFLTGHDLRQERRMAGRLASIKVIFSEKYEGPNYTESEVNRLYDEIEKDVRKSLDVEK